MTSFTRHAVRMFAGLLAVLVLLGCGKKPDAPEPDQGKGDPEKKGPAQPDKPAQPLGKADFSLTAVDFRKEFDAGSAAASAKYKGKVIEVSGTVDYAERHQDGKQGVVMLKSAKADPSCACNVADRNIAGKIGPDQTVRIKGRFLNNLGTPALADCEVLEKGADTLILITAENLAKEYSADPEACGKRLKKKALVVTGELSVVKPGESGGTFGENATFGELKGDGKTVIKVVTTVTPWPTEYKTGTKVKFVADLWLTDRGECKLSIQGVLDE